MPKRIWLIFGLGLTGLCLVGLIGVVLYQYSPLTERLVWRIENLRARVFRQFNPPEQVVFVPGVPDVPLQGETPPGLTATPPAPQVLRATTSLPPTSITLPPTLEPTASPRPTSTPLPGAVLLSGIRHEYQQFNNCGPANLAMALSYWGWQGDQRDTRRFLRPNLKVDDKNVNPSEMAAFVEKNTGLQALVRFGGDLDLLRRLIAAGFPVLVEAGHHPPDDWWMGHYLVVNGYDDTRSRFTVQDSLKNPDLSLPYDELGGQWWRDFNYVYLVIFPPERREEVALILGEQIDPIQNYEYTRQKALADISALQGRDLFFAWFNLGASYIGLNDHTRAAQAYDQAFEIYQTLSEDQRPYRLMWYVDGPYAAYYHSGRFQDVVNLANTTFVWVGQPVLEESYYWRGKAYLALGNQNLAIQDLQKAAQLNSNYLPPRQELQLLGIALP